MSVSIGNTHISGITTAIDQYDAAYKEYVDSINTISSLTSDQVYEFLYNTGSSSSWVGINSYTEYTTSGTSSFTIPDQCKELTFILTGGGGGGGGGGSGPSNVYGYDSGGGGGGGGASAMWTIPKSIVTGTTITVTVGAGGPGGPGSPAAVANGSAGTAGGTTSVSMTGDGGYTYVFSVPGGSGGGFGSGGTTGSAGAGGAGGAIFAIDPNYVWATAGTTGGRGARISAPNAQTSTAGTNMSSGYQCTGGGGGGANAGSDYPPSGGGAIYVYENTYQTSNPPFASRNATAISGISYGYGGAGGFGSNYVGNPGGTGARGGGGGGGGGGQGTSTFGNGASGPGGAGGAGYVMIMWRG